ncbi:MAG: hypothetical protein G01um101433_437 [Parcubacteria group bacterium Gr01-1014_33]|nr:MAG: hypothetical protein G01um101433_437 [Parcubacteria group bacterium Gr01-1014_33]
MAETKNQGKKLQLNLTDEDITDLDLLQRKIKAPSRSQTIRYALRLLQWAADEIGKGNKICLERPEGVREVLIPFLKQRQK